jgi:hypothetical protein
MYVHLSHSSIRHFGEMLTFLIAQIVSLGRCIRIRLLVHQRNCLERTFGRYGGSQSCCNESLQNRRSIFFILRSNFWFDVLTRSNHEQL